MSSQEIPLFPLGTVLFPDGPLPLKIFETRYVDMVSRCASEDLAFGIALLVSADDSGVARLAEVGTSARIIDWNQGSDGLLYITAMGERRFRILSARQQEDGLNLAEVEWLPAESPAAPQPTLRAMASALRALFATSGLLYESIEKKYSDASWVGFRLAEILPLAPETRQRCLELRSASARLELLQPVVKQVAASRRQTPE